MRDVDAFTKLLQLQRLWLVEQVILDSEDQSVGVFVTHRKNARFHCPVCRAVLQSDETLKGTKYFWFFSEENLPATC